MVGVELPAVHARRRGEAQRRQEPEFESEGGRRRRRLGRASTFDSLVVLSVTVVAGMNVFHHRNLRVGSSRANDAHLGSSSCLEFG